MEAPAKPLCLYEELMLLAVRDETGTFAAGFVEQAVAGAILSELMLCGRITSEPTSQLIAVKNPEPVGDALIDQALAMMTNNKRQQSMQQWISRLAGLPNLRHRIASQLCERQILRLNEEKILFLFTRRTYPEVNPGPEQEIIERMRVAIFTDGPDVDARTAILISLANGAEVLPLAFSRSELKERRSRIDQIANGNLTGKATQEVINACKAAIMVAAIMPAIIATTIN